VHVVTLRIRSNSFTPEEGDFNQRELARFENYPSGLRAALRQAPKIILVGEMRIAHGGGADGGGDGPFVLSTLHTVDATADQPFLVFR
jgi:twitching motility protein PilT